MNLALRHSRPLRSNHEHPWALMSTKKHWWACPWWNENSWVQMVPWHHAHKCSRMSMSFLRTMVPCSWVLKSVHKGSWVVLNAHEQSWTHMSMAPWHWEHSWALMRTLEYSFAIISKRKHSWAWHHQIMSTHEHWRAFKSAHSNILLTALKYP